MQTALLRTMARLIALAALPAWPLWAQTTCSSPIGIYPAVSSVLLNSPQTLTQVLLSSNSYTPFAFTISNIQSAGGWLGVSHSWEGNFSTSSFTGYASAGAPYKINVAA